MANYWFVKDDNGRPLPILAGGRCNRCGKIFFPRKTVCSICAGKDVKGVALSNRGKLLSYSIVNRGMKHIKAPYALGYVWLQEGIKLYTLISDYEPAARRLKIGAEMELVLDKIVNPQSGEEELIYKFRPVD